MSSGTATSRNRMTVRFFVPTEKDVFFGRTSESSALAVTRVGGTMESPAPETLAGISVDAVREQLAQLGHDDVSDEVIREFLKQLTADAAFLEDAAVPPQAAPAHARPRRAARTTSSAARARAASAAGPSARESAREEPEPARVPTSPLRRTPRCAKKKAPSGIDATRTAEPTPARRAAVARGADGAPIPAAASPYSPRTPSTASSARASGRPREASTPRSTFGSAPRFAENSRRDADAPLRPSSARPSSPTRTRVVAARLDSARRDLSGSNLINSSSVIRAAIPAARGAKPGQYRVTDRVARAAQYSVAWRKDAFLKNAELRTDARERAAVVPRKPQNFAAAFARAQARAEARVEEAKRAARAEKKTERAEKMSREDWERHFELSRRARVKLTDAGDARGEKTKRGGGTTRGSKPAAPRGFTAPSDNRRDDVRWEVRRRMAAPPVLSR